MPSESENLDLSTAIGYARYAFDYIQAAITIETSDPSNNLHSPIPAYFLVIHGIELTLKSFLRHKGITATALRGNKYGHDLPACYRKAKEFGLHQIFNEHPFDRDAMRMLVLLNEHQGLRYVKTGLKEFPAWSIVEPLAIRLHQSIAPMVGYHSFEKVYQAYS